MRADLVDITLALIVLGAFVGVWLVKDDDADWKRRWAELSPAERSRLAAAARSGTLLASQEDIELAAGFARRDRRRRGPYWLLYSIRIPLGIALIAGGLVADSLLFLIFGVVFLLGGLWSTRSTFRIARAERETISRDRRP